MNENNQRNQYPLFDLHCDTVYECWKQKQTFSENQLHLDLKRGKPYQPWLQTFAFWISGQYQGEAAWMHFLEQYRYFAEQYQKNRTEMTWYDGKKPKPLDEHQCHALLSLENASLLTNHLERVAQLKEMGISSATLTWNQDNALSGAALDSGSGLTSFGKQAVQELEQQNIIIDLSHLSDAGIEDVLAISRCPVIASHSNARVVCEHKRNLSDDHIRALIACEGLMGINFYSEFVNDKEEYVYSELFAHIDHVLRLGGEQILAIGSDFDGATMPKIIPDVKGLEKLAQTMINYFGTTMTNRILFSNAKQFFDRNLEIKGKIQHVVS